MTWDEIRELSRDDLLKLATAYSDYVIEYGENTGEGMTGGWPVCIAEFYDNECREDEEERALPKCPKCGERLKSVRVQAFATFCYDLYPDEGETIDTESTEFLEDEDMESMGLMDRVSYYCEECGATLAKSREEALAFLNGGK